MATNEADFSIGVEEEYQIVDPESRELRPLAAKLLPRARASAGEEVTNELFLAQIEIGTPVCVSLGEVRGELSRLRSTVIEAARREGARIIAAATHPFSHWSGQPLTPKARYFDLAHDFQQLTREQIICGCHVHIGIADKEAAVQVMNRVRPWLPTLLALSANSPYWLGIDTGYASYRTNLFGRFPMTGAPHLFESRAEFDEVIESLQSSGVIEDGSFLYWDARPSSHVETLEFRIADVCQTIDEAVLIAGLSRAIARTCYWQWRRGEPIARVRPELVRAASWWASRYGMDGELIDPLAQRKVPATEMANRLLEFIRPSLQETGDLGEIQELLALVQGRGTGARRQREAMARSSRLESVVDLLIEETERGVTGPTSIESPSKTESP